MISDKNITFKSFQEPEFLDFSVPFFILKILYFFKLIKNPDVLI